MTNQHAFRPTLEPLEDRWTPATVRFFSGFLMVNLDPSETLTLTQTANNEFQVGMGGAFGTFAGVNNIYLTGSNGGDNVTVALADKTYSGNMYLNLGFGDDTIAVSSALGAGTVGNVTILPGFGNDSTTLTACVGGNFTVTNQLGDDSLVVTGGAIEIGGSANIYNVPNINVTAGGNSIGGDLTIQNIQANLGGDIDLDGLVVSRNLNLTTGNGAEDVQFDGLTVLGNLFVSLNGGDDTLYINHDAGTTSIFGNSTVNLGNGNDSVRIDSAIVGNTTFFGNLSIDLGEGDQTLNLFNERFVVAGNFTLKAGNGNNITPVGNSIRPTVFGNVTFNFGNGNNRVNFAGAVFGRFTFIAGNGNNEIVLTETTASSGQSFYMVDVRTGGGDDTLTLAGSTGASITGFVNLGGGTNTFDQGTPPWTIVNPWLLTI